MPAVNLHLRRLCETYFKTELLIVGEPDCELGIKVLIDRPQEAGADRLVGVIAGYQKHGGPLITVDFGSATTFDLVDKDGNFVGGVLAPGVELTIESFYLMTARLPRIRVEKPAQVIGKATVPAMQSGIFWGYVGLIESLIKRIRAEYGEPMKVDRHRRAGRRVQGRDRAVRRHRAGPDVARPAGDLAPQPLMTVPSDDELLFLALGGAGEIGMNLNLLRPRRQMADGRSRHRLRRRFDAGRRRGHAGPGLHRGARARTWWASC